MTKVKICGLFRLCDIEYANQAKPDYVGFVFAKSKRQVTKKKAQELRSCLGENIIPVGVFVDEEIEFIVELVKGNIISVVQLHGMEDEIYIQSLRKKVTVPIIKAVKVTSSNEILEAQKLSADYLLLDQGAGGTGKTFDWTLVSSLEISKPIFLAGGINIENAEDGIKTIHPFALDISSGVETDGVKDKNKIQEIIRRIRNV